MEFAERAAASSTDPITQVGVVFMKADIILISGCNRVPRHVMIDSERTEGSLKAYFTEHAERDAIFSAARTGISLSGSTCVCTLFPCADCARALIACGAIKLISTEPNFCTPSKWRDHWIYARKMLEEAGVEIEFYYRNK